MDPTTEMTGDGALDIEQAVSRRYTKAAASTEPALCCPVQYDGRYLEVLPQELIQRDYGCGDPSRFVNRGETVLDLGSGGGKICYIVSQIVGPDGEAIGVDMNDDMLALARGFQREVGDRIGWHNVRFCKGRIQDLSLDLERFEAYLRKHPVQSVAQWSAAAQYADQLRQTEPMIASDSVDVVLSNCVLNLVDPRDRKQLFREVYRVLKRGGRAVISDIVCDEDPPERLKQDPELWSGCISGAHLESALLAQFEAAGFYGVEILERQSAPWAVVDGIEFRSMTVRAFKGKDGPCMDHNQAVIYQGPWKSVCDDDGHVLKRGERMAVCQKTFDIYTRAPYADQIIPVPPQQTVSDADAQPFDCRRNQVRSPRETKNGPDSELTILPASDCCSADDGQCC